MAEAKPPAKRGTSLPSVFADVGSAAQLPAGNHWLGFQSSVLKRNGAVVQRSADYLDARRRQSNAYTALIDARMRIARKLAELADLPNVLAEDQRGREHARLVAETSRQSARVEARRAGELAAIRHATELARLQEARVRAERNLEAAQRVKDAQLDEWYAQAQARTNNALAEFQDTRADLAGAGPSPSGDSAQAEKAALMPLLDQQIELERGRGNEAAVLALLNLKALLKGE